MRSVLVIFVVVALCCEAAAASESKFTAESKEALKKLSHLSQMDFDQARQIIQESGLAQVVKFSSEKVEPVGAGPYRPVVQMHGMGDYANNPFGMVPLKELIEQRLNTYVVNVPLADDALFDMLNTFIMNMNNEVLTFAEYVKKDPNLANGFNAVGYSQGNLIIRGYIEMVNDPPIYNWVSMHGPNVGVAGFPDCNMTSIFCQWVDELLGDLAYNSLIQSFLAQANYFRDPLRIPYYLSGDLFLADINNEKNSTNASYKSNFTSINHMALVKALGDTVVEPNESEWWGFFEDGSDTKVLTMRETSWYENDLFGLKTMDQNGRLSFYSTEGNHLRFNNTFLLQMVDKYFTN